MLDDAFAHLESEIQAGMIQVALFELLDDSQCVQIVVETAAVFAHALIELLFPRMTEGWMSYIVDERQRLR